MHYARFAKMPEEVLHAKQLSLADRMVYLDMAFQAWFTNRCVISQARIASRLGISTRQVKRSQAKLEAERYITAIETAPRKVTVYQLNSRVFAPRKRSPWGHGVTIDSKSKRPNGDIMSPLSRNNREIQ